MNNLLECRNLSKYFGPVRHLIISPQHRPRSYCRSVGTQCQRKSTFMKICNDLLTQPRVKLELQVSVRCESKKIVSYLPERNYLND